VLTAIIFAVPNAIPGPVFTADSQHQENPSSPEPTRHHSHAVAVATGHTSLYWYRGQQDVPEAADPVCRSAVIACTTVSTCAVNSVPARSGDGGFVAARGAATRESLVPEPALPRRGCRALARRARLAPTAGPGRPRRHGPRTRPVGSLPQRQGCGPFADGVGDGGEPRLGLQPVRQGRVGAAMLDPVQLASRSRMRA
jgi:hypothetical protein